MQSTFAISSDIDLHQDKEVWFFKKYEPNKPADTLNHMTFFVADEGIDMADLERYQKATQTEFLIAINATGKDYACLTLADNIIHCSSDEVDLVMIGLGNMLSDDVYIGMDWLDIYTSIKDKRYIKFLHSHAKGKDCISVVCKNLTTKISSLQSKYFLVGAIIHTLTDVNFSSDNYDIITTQMENNLAVNPADLLYQVSFYDSFKYWNTEEQGCCMCLYLAYSDKPNPCTPPSRSEPLNLKPTGSLLQDYLRKNTK